MLLQIQKASNHCNTQQHLASNCNMLQHAATHRNSPQYQKHATAICTGRPEQCDQTENSGWGCTGRRCLALPQHVCVLVRVSVRGCRYESKDRGRTLPHLAYKFYAQENFIKHRMCLCVCVCLTHLYTASSARLEPQFPPNATCGRYSRETTRCKS